MTGVQTCALPIFLHLAVGDDDGLALLELMLVVGDDDVVGLLVAADNLERLHLSYIVFVYHGMM